ncbi:hypothetical protein VPHD249_0014 [Vibrio phage D249]|nr:hypothetical protein SIPHO036v1_10016 [Vibrio phage 70E38.1]QZI87930.1 hypothetical protein SIPHO041v1_p0019 [Vibrio phage 234P1]QZI88099.1 hypothetical protein SIPHO035v1_p0008 [Vibrio phage 234P7B]QZI88433.1 hypothetical protein SIPHO082v1_p0156 [Vibrio phage 294E48.1]QZI88651.1 hypothetical protein SIPHO039v1_p0022 [Vibrio phage 70E35.5a]QZI88837.1 hypothetical protein SIPHO040v1_p0024 [Vibrio phage 70E35.6]QZI89003.1 hypothetical protein SIPHO042v1_p0006 [Vibrio phage 70E37.1]QZI89284
MTDVTKDITSGDSNKTVILPIKQAFLESSPLIGRVFDKVDWDAGILLYPYTKVPKSGEDTYVIAGMELTKDTDFIDRSIVKETVEDAAPETKIYQTLVNIMVQDVSQKVEKTFVDQIIADANIQPVAGAGADWTGIVSLITDMGAYVYNTKGSFVVMLSLADHLTLAGDADFERAHDALKDKIEVMVSSKLEAGQMIVIHEHGIAGSATIKEMEIDAAPSSDMASLIMAYRTGLNYDLDFIRVVK